MLIKNITLSLIVLWLVGCSNAVSYHHSERSSIALEVRTTDPQQPVQGIIGVKTRTIVVAPKIADDKESTSVISDFNLNRKENENFFGFGTTKIQSAFMTGEAAENASASTAAALSGLGIDGAGDSAIFKRNIMANIYRFLDQNKANNVKAKEHLERLNKLVKLLPKDYVSNTYYLLTGKVLEKKDTSGYQAKPQGFLEVLNYEQTLVSSSIASLNQMKKDRSIQYKASTAGLAADISATDLAMLQGELKRLKVEKQVFFNLIGNHNAIDMAAAYMVSSL